MKYMGSKSRISQYIVPIIQDYIDRNNICTYIEPFVGGANVIDKIRCKERIGADINEYLIALLNFVKSDGALPDMISKQQYDDVKNHMDQYQPWYVGCAGFLSSYNAKFFGGYAGRICTKSGTIRNYYDEAKRNLMKQAPHLKDVHICQMDYKSFRMRGCVVYCDPPYQSTTGYSGTDDFNHSEFWETVRRWSLSNIVIVSEQTAPEDFQCIWSGNVIRTMDKSGRAAKTEKLFIYKGCD